MSIAGLDPTGFFLHSSIRVDFIRATEEQQMYWYYKTILVFALNKHKLWLIA